MKSPRESALAQTSSVRPGHIDLGPEATKILKRLERARNYGAKKKYNAELQKLIKEYPDFHASILALHWK
jgi:hypothetical protein